MTAPKKRGLKRDDIEHLIVGLLAMENLVRTSETWRVGGVNEAQKDELGKIADIRLLLSENLSAEQLYAAEDRSTVFANYVTETMRETLESVERRKLSYDKAIEEVNRATADLNAEKEKLEAARASLERQATATPKAMPTRRPVVTSAKKPYASLSASGITYREKLARAYEWAASDKTPDIASQASDDINAARFFAVFIDVDEEVIPNLFRKRKTGALGKALQLWFEGENQEMSRTRAEELAWRYCQKYFPNAPAKEG